MSRDRFSRVIIWWWCDEDNVILSTHRRGPVPALRETGRSKGGYDDLFGETDVPETVLGGA